MGINNKHVKYDLNSINENSKFIARGSVMDYSFNSFMNDKSKVNNNSKHFMYQNKSNLCTGYMPSFISLDCNEGYEFTKGNNQSLYYLYTKDGKYLKPLSNNVSKYNNMYFGKMRHAYNISKRHSNQILSDTKRSIPINCTLKPYFINNGKTNINVKNINSSNNNNSPKLKNNNNNNNRYYRHSNTEPRCPKRRTPGGPGLEGTEEGTPIKCSLGGSKRRSNGASGGKHTYKHTHQHTKTPIHRQTDRHTYIHTDRQTDRQ